MFSALNSYFDTIIITTFIAQQIDWWLTLPFACAVKKSIEIFSTYTVLVISQVNFVNLCGFFIKGVSATGHKTLNLYFNV